MNLFVQIQSDYVKGLFRNINAGKVVLFFNNQFFQSHGGCVRRDISNLRYKIKFLKFGWMDGGMRVIINNNVIQYLVSLG